MKIPTRIIDSSRLSRAKKISKSKVNEFEVVSEEPLIAFSIIQGSSSSPYTVIIDFENNKAYHSCPDYNRISSYCKHFGKLFLLLPEDLLYYFITNYRNLDKKTSGIDKRLKEIKTSLVEKKIEENTGEEINIADTIDSYLSTKNNKLLKLIINFMEKELDENDNYLYFMRFMQFISIPTGLTRKNFTSAIASSFEKNFISHVQSVLAGIRAHNIVKNLELVYLISEIANKMKYELPQMDSSYLDDVSIVELRNLTAIADLLYQYTDRKFKLFTDNLPANFVYSDNTEIIFENIRKQIYFNDTSLSAIKSWVNRKLKKAAIISFSMDYIDDFLIYTMLSNREDIRYKVSLYKGLARLSTTLLEENAALRFVISEIKESEREYITSEEFNQHTRFFNWLNRRSVTSSYRERPRHRTADMMFNNKGIIVQWKINANKLHNDKFYAHHEGNRLKININSIIFKILQPFDYTFSTNQKLAHVDKYIKSTNPNYIMLPDQVVNLVLQGVPIISNVLPWNILSDFARTGYIHGGDISVGIKKCQEFSFVYGSTALKNALEKISKLGKTGISEENYAEIYSSLKMDSGRLNSLSRPLAKQIIAAEGAFFDVIVSNIGLNEKQQQLLVIKTVRCSPDIEKFRSTLANEILKKLKKYPDKWLSIIQADSSDILGHYLHIKDKLRSYIIKEAEVVNKLASSGTQQSKSRIFKNPLGKIFCDQMNITNYKQITDLEFNKFRNFAESIIELK